MSIPKLYNSEIKDNTNYTPTWLPGVRIRLGDVLQISNGECQHVASLDGLGIPFEAQDGGEFDFDYASRNAVSVALKLAGESPAVGSGLGQADAGLVIRFSRPDAIVFRAKRCRSRQIKNVQEVGEQVLARFDRRDWPEDHVVVTEVLTAEQATIVISSGANAQIDLRAAGTLQAGAIELADAEAKLSVARESEIGIRIIATDGLTPLFRTRGVCTHVFRKTDFRGPGARPRKEDEVLAFDYVDYDDFAPA